MFLEPCPCQVSVTQACPARPLQHRLRELKAQSGAAALETSRTQEIKESCLIQRCERDEVRQSVVKWNSACQSSVVAGKVELTEQSEALADSRGSWFHLYIRRWMLEICIYCHLTQRIQIIYLVNFFLNKNFHFLWCKRIPVRRFLCKKGYFCLSEHPAQVQCASVKVSPTSSQVWLQPSPRGSPAWGKRQGNKNNNVWG